MTCDAYRILITGYIDDELSDADMAALKAHLRACEPCVQHLKRQEALRITLKRYAFIQDAPVVPTSFAQSVTARLQAARAEEQPALRPHWTPRAAWQGATDIVSVWGERLKIHSVRWAAATCSLALLAGLASFMLLSDSPNKQAAQLQANAAAMPTALEQPRHVSSAPHPNTASDAAAPNSDAVAFGFVEDASEVPSVQKQPSTGGGYVYSHIVGGYQDRLVDDAMFVTYTQDAFLQ